MVKFRRMAIMPLWFFFSSYLLSSFRDDFSFGLLNQEWSDVDICFHSIQWNICRARYCIHKVHALNNLALEYFRLLQEHPNQTDILSGNSLARGIQCHICNQHVFPHPRGLRTSLHSLMRVLSVSCRFHDLNNHLDRLSFRKPFHRNSRNTCILQFRDRKDPYWSIPLEGEHHLLQLADLPMLLLSDKFWVSSRVLSKQSRHLGDCNKCIGLEYFKV